MAPSPSLLSYQIAPSCNWIIVFRSFDIIFLQSVDLHYRSMFIERVVILYAPENSIIFWV